MGQTVVEEPLAVRALYDRLYSTRTTDPNWTSKWQAFVRSMHRLKQPYLVNLIVSEAYSSVADMGCGTGDLLKDIRKAGFKRHLVAIDENISASLGRSARKHDFEVKKADFKTVKDRYDAVIFFSALHYATLSEAEQVLRNLSGTPNYYVVEPFIEHKENADLESKLAEKTNNICHLFREKDLDSLFLKNSFKIKSKYEYPKNTDAMARIFTFTHYCL